MKYNYFSTYWELVSFLQVSRARIKSLMGVSGNPGVIYPCLDKILTWPGTIKGIVSDFIILSMPFLI